MNIKRVLPFLPVALAFGAGCFAMMVFHEEKEPSRDNPSEDRTGIRSSHSPSSSAFVPDSADSRSRSPVLAAPVESASPGSTIPVAQGASPVAPSALSAFVSRRRQAAVNAGSSSSVPSAPVVPSSLSSPPAAPSVSSSGFAAPSGNGAVSTGSSGGGTVGGGTSSGGTSTGASPEVSSGGEIVVDVPPGNRAPAVFLDDTQHTPQQNAALDSIAQDFADEVAQLPASGSGQQSTLWQQAAQRADDRYRILFGDDAANNLQVKAAREVLQQQAVQTAAAPATQ